MFISIWVILKKFLLFILDICKLDSSLEDFYESLEILIKRNIKIFLDKAFSSGVFFNIFTILFILFFSILIKCRVIILS
jgi:hypothetical protein